jgi:hypothetical protein
LGCLSKREDRVTTRRLKAGLSPQPSTWSVSLASYQAESLSLRAPTKSAAFCDCRCGSTRIVRQVLHGSTATSAFERRLCGHELAKLSKGPSVQAVASSMPNSSGKRYLAVVRDVPEKIRSTSLFLAGKQGALTFARRRTESSFDQRASRCSPCRRPKSGICRRMAWRRAFEFRRLQQIQRGNSPGGQVKIPDACTSSRFCKLSPLQPPSGSRSAFACCAVVGSSWRFATTFVLCSRFVSTAIPCRQ